MTEFEKGVEFAFKYIKERMVGRVVNGHLDSVVTENHLKRLQEEVTKKCQFCEIPCGQSWCSTKE